MKKLSVDQRKRDVKIGLSHRQGRKRVLNTKIRLRDDASWHELNEWIDKRNGQELDISFINKKFIVLNLPEKMNFNYDYNVTALNISAIRKFSEKKHRSNKCYRLRTVNFDNLKKSRHQQH